MTNSNVEMKKIIWMLWLQGYENAPSIVHRCIDSWVTRNPDWQVKILDKETVNDYVNIDIPASTTARLSAQHFADVLRFALLSKHGGVWADATLYCRKPLNSWLPGQMGAGFFAFANEAEDREMSTWFLAANSGNRIASALYEAQRKYWLTYSRITYCKPKVKIIRKLQKKFPRIALRCEERTYGRIASNLLSKITLYPPYFLVNYLFSDLLYKSEEIRGLWKKVSTLPATDPLLISRLGYVSTVDEEKKRLIHESSSPVFKLSWKAKRPERRREYLLNYISDEIG